MLALCLINRVIIIDAPKDFFSNSMYYEIMGNLSCPTNICNAVKGFSLMGF